jgi:hypothetical protein
MKKSIIVCLFVSIAFLSQGLVADDWGRASLNKYVQLDLAIDEIAQVNIDVGAGDLVIKGKKGQSEIEVIAKVYGDELNDDDSSGDIHAKNISGLVTVEDSSGDIIINGAADFVLKNDGSGDVRLINIKRNMK